MDLQPVLQNDLIRLQPMRLEDYESIYQAASDPLIWEVHPQPDRYQREVFQDFFDSAMESKGAFVAIDPKTNEVVGSSRYYNYDPTKKSVTIGYTFLTRKYWGGNYNFEMKKLMIQHAFRFVDTVVFEVGAKNIRSRKAMEKIGGILTREEIIRNTDHVIYEIKKNDRNRFAE